MGMHYLKILKMFGEVESIFLFFFVEFKSIGAEPHIRPYIFVDYLRPPVPDT